MGKNIILLFFCLLASSSVFSAPAPRTPYWDNQGLFTKIFHTGEKGSKTSVGQTNVNIVDHSHSTTNVGHRGAYRADDDHDSFPAEVKRSRYRNSSDSSLDSSEEMPIWDNRGLFTEIHNTGEAGSETNFGQTNIDIKDYTQSLTNIGHRKSYNRPIDRDSGSDDESSSIEYKRTWRTTPWDSISSHHSGGWNNGGLITRIYHNAKEGSTTNFGKKNIDITDYSRRRTNIYGSSSSERECDDSFEDVNC